VQTIRGSWWRLSNAAQRRVLFISWEREAGSNDFSYQKYFLPMLSSFKLLK
jgi:hypothetical protein